MHFAAGTGQVPAGFELNLARASPVALSATRLAASDLAQSTTAHLMVTEVQAAKQVAAARAEALLLV